ncbi:hypothetical protein D4T97_015410 [Siminovitchia acidinfaciens]|uniref:Cas12f1-like TNB domain-containing protein n=1 Tax=Siminovitchia acidinfaciens TaxID=2321395 RepID=A0A429XWR4_9BACI|nr:hypothetical protein D4T97_015410 [Siminovitchia acidinfaciens]
MGERCSSDPNERSDRHTGKSRIESGRNLHNWLHYQLQHFIENKAKMVGIAVEYVNPEHTSQTCKCGHVDKRNSHLNNFHCINVAIKAIRTSVPP